MTDDEPHEDDDDVFENEFDDEKPRGEKGRDDRENLDDSERESFWERRFGKKLEGFVPDIVKRTLVASLGSLFLSDDGLKQTLTDLRLPKEIVNFILQQADNTKREFMKLVARETREFLESTNFYDEMRKILTSLSFEIRTEVRLIPNDQAFVKPSIKNRVRVKRNGKDAVDFGDEDDDELVEEEEEPKKSATKPKPAKKEKDKDRDKDRDKEEGDEEA